MGEKKAYFFGIWKKKKKRDFIEKGLGKKKKKSGKY